GANRRLPVAAGNLLSVDAVFVVLRYVGMTLGAGSGDVELEYRGLGIASAQDVMGSVAIGTNRGFLGAASHRFAVNTLLVGVEGSGTNSAGTHDQFLPVAGAAGLRDVGVRYLRFGIAGRQDGVNIAVAVLAFGYVGVA